MAAHARRPRCNVPRREESVLDAGKIRRGRPGSRPGGVEKRGASSHVPVVGSVLRMNSQIRRKAVKVT